MKWNTIYITGIEDFWDDVNKKLNQSDLNFLTGYIEQRPDSKFHGLYWLDNKVEMRQFKEAIGAKNIWKYRLNFFFELEYEKELGGKTEPTSFSEKEKALIKSMRMRKSVQV
jgi:hypothetical protein